MSCYSGVDIQAQHDDLPGVVVEALAQMVAELVAMLQEQAAEHREKLEKLLD